MKNKYLVFILPVINLFMYAEQKELYSLDAFLESSSPLYKLAKFTADKFSSKPESGHEDKVWQRTEQGPISKVQDQLMIAINRGGSCDVQKAISMGADVNARSAFGNAPLHWASLLDSADILNLLLKYGADIDIKDRNGKTPLHWAARRGNAQAVKALLTYGAKMNIADSEGLIPLDYAEDAETRSALLEASDLG